MKFKLEHGVFFEPKAISDYELFTSNSGRPVSVEKSGLVVNTDNYVLTTTFSEFLPMAK